MKASLISTFIRYEADGATMAWPIPFPYAKAADVAVKTVDWAGGAERRLVQGADYIIDDASRCVLAVVPAGRSVCIWLDRNLEQTVQAVAANAISAQTRDASEPLSGPVYAAPVTAPANQARAYSDPSLVQPASESVATAAEPVVMSEVTATVDNAAVAELKERLAKIEAANDAALVAVRAAQTDSQMASIQTAGADAVAQAVSAIDDETQKALDALEAKAQEALAAAKAAQTATDAALEEAQNERAALEAYKAELDARAVEFGKSVSLAQSQITSLMESEADRAAGSLKTSVMQYASEARSAKTLSIEARDDSARSATVARTQREASQSAAYSARSDAGAAATARNGSEAAANLAMTWARASGYSAAAAHEQALCAGLAAFEATIAAKQPGISCVRSVEDMVDALPGYYFVDPEIRQSPSQFMGLYAVESVEDMGWDAFFFIDTPWPDTPVMPPSNVPDLPAPVYPDGNTDGNYWLPCDHEHSRQTA